MPGDFVLQRNMHRSDGDNAYWPNSIGTQVSGLRIDDPELNNQAQPTLLSDYFNIIRGRLPPTNNGKVRVLILAGCANLQTEPLESEEAFYEFSHKRAVVHNTFITDLNVSSSNASPESLEIESRQFDNTIAPYILGNLPVKPRFTSCNDVLKHYSKYANTFLQTDAFWKDVSPVDPNAMDLELGGGKRSRSYRKKQKKRRLTRRH
jgi:hypothetical protein